MVEMPFSFNAVTMYCADGELIPRNESQSSSGIRFQLPSIRRMVARMSAFGAGATYLVFEDTRMQITGRAAEETTVGCETTRAVKRADGGHLARADRNAVSDRRCR